MPPLVLRLQHVKYSRHEWKSWFIANLTSIQKEYYTEDNHRKMSDDRLADKSNLWASSELWGWKILPEYYVQADGPMDWFSWSLALCHFRFGKYQHEYSAFSLQDTRRRTCSFWSEWRPKQILLMLIILAELKIDVSLLPVNHGHKMVFLWWRHVVMVLTGDITKMSSVAVSAP